jgi:hypothetical protein
VTEFSLLAGLPPYGDLPRAFPPEWGRLGREGVVVRFVRSDGRAWVGNFRPGLAGLWAVRAHPDGRRVLVFAGGDLWVVSPDTEAADLAAGDVDAMWPVHGPDGLVMSLQGLGFARLGPDGILWRTRRLSWDGFRDVRAEGGRLVGLAWNALGDRWDPFEVDLATGASTGGSFGPGDPEGWERLAPARGAV